MVQNKTENNQFPSKKKVSKTYTKKGGNGGVRVGSGRKVGTATKRTRKIADDLAASEGITPLDWMLQTLRETPEKLKAQHESGEIDITEYTIKMQEMIRRKDRAAETAAVYIHPRLSSITADVGLKGHDLWVSLLEEQE
jgi:hypothetical protein